MPLARVLSRSTTANALMDRHKFALACECTALVDKHLHLCRDLRSIADQSENIYLKPVISLKELLDLVLHFGAHHQLLTLDAESRKLVTMLLCHADMFGNFLAKLFSSVCVIPD